MSAGWAYGTREITILFPRQCNLPPGYKVCWWEQDEHYHWHCGDTVVSVIFGDRWQAYREAWAHYRVALADAGKEPT